MLQGRERNSKENKRFKSQRIAGLLARKSEDGERMLRLAGKVNEFSWTS
jgi:hypothetical protein